MGNYHFWVTTRAGFVSFETDQRFVSIFTVVSVPLGLHRHVAMSRDLSILRREAGACPGRQRLRLTTGADLKRVSHAIQPLIGLLARPSRTRGDRMGLVEMKLRLYRNYSIKLMLAWETCCRSDQTPSSLPRFPSQGY